MGFRVTHQFADLVLPVWRRPGGGADHSGGLIVCQLLDAALPCHDVTHLDRKTATGQPPMASHGERKKKTHTLTVIVCVRSSSYLHTSRGR